MSFDCVIANPPFDIGNKIMVEALNYLTENGKASVLMPLSQYKRKELYRHIEKFELVDPKIFKGAVIQNNLNITLLTRKKLNIYLDYEYFSIVSTKSPLLNFYLYNKFNNKKHTFCTLYYKKSNDYNINIDFIDIRRCTKQGEGGYFSKNGFGYKWNVIKDFNKENFPSEIELISFYPNNTEKSKNNFCKYAYNYIDNPYNCLASKALTYIYAEHLSASFYYIIPQIDWENININQKELWDKGLYDEAVLNEMGLKWDETKTKIIEK